MDYGWINQNVFFSSLVTLQNGGLVVVVVMMMMKYRGVGRRWEIECIEPGMEEIRQIMLSLERAMRPPNSTENINRRLGRKQI